MLEVDVRCQQVSFRIEAGPVQLDIMGGSPKLHHKAVLAVIGCGARWFFFSFLSFSVPFSQQVRFQNGK